ncbi:MAG TPA: hypothetical protein VK186_24275 [Candidatus Deferrimicrobium sp.]|nr:hypothetical protein [Candidatus Deferrimicrobium sp.]
MVRKQKGETRKETCIGSGPTLPAVVLGFCGICDIPMRQENEELLLLLQVPEVFEYVLSGVLEVVAQESFK